MITTNSAFTIFRLTLAAVITVDSLLTAIHSAHPITESHLAQILPWVAGAEAFAGMLLFFRTAVKFGAAILLLIFFMALIVHGPAGQMHLLVYAAGVVLVAVDLTRSRDRS